MELLLNPLPEFKFLIVDNDEDDHFFLKTAIAEAVPNSSVHSVYNGCEAMQYLTGISGEELPDMIFMDLNMDKLCGRKTTEIIKNNASLNSIPIVVLTTSKSLEDRQELFRLGADDFLTKPPCIQELARMVRNVSERFLFSKHQVSADL